MYTAPRVTTPPGSTPPQLVLASSGSRTWDSGAGGGRSNKERQRLQPLASVARASLFEVRGARFTHSPYWHTSVTHEYFADLQIQTLSSLSLYPSPSLSLSLWPLRTFKAPQKQPQPKQCELCSKHINSWDQTLPLARIHTDNHRCPPWHRSHW